MQQDMKIIAFKIVECMGLRFCTLNNFIGSGITVVFIIFHGGTPPKFFNNFLFIDFLQSAKS